VVMPGAFTPTEVIAAWEAGADVVKIFPSDLGGPPYLKALRGPLPQVRMMPTGGVDLSTAEAFLKAGACCLGVGSSLVEARAVASGDFARLRDLAGQFSSIVREFRSS
jgi:2-dehydro-3-deoxyphosphogluconate aldolase/(4S)-4-hydroxy-2-oxoglutarate aldolase